MSISHQMLLPLGVQYQHRRRWKLYRNPKFLIIFYLSTILLVVLITLTLISISIEKNDNCNFTDSMKICYQKLSFHKKMPTIYVITPTYDRYVQKAELTRLSQTFMLVPNLHWIIVEDSTESTAMIIKMISRLRNKFNFTQITGLYAKTPDTHKRRIHQPKWLFPRGVWQRNKALEWIRENAINLDHNGVIYFADDDNTYDIELFDEMRDTKRVSVWPVGLVGELLVEKPIVKGNKVVSFNSVWDKQRPFPIDMAAFAISMQLFMSRRNVSFSADQRVGYLESHFLSQVIDSRDNLEPKANNCTKVLVWHTRTQSPELEGERKLLKPSMSDMEM